jgi:MFS family permease
MKTFEKDRQFFKFCAYGFLKNLRFFDAFLLLFFLENGISYSQIGILYAVREITINVLEIPSGIVADTYGRKNSLLAAFLAYILSFIVFYYSIDFYLLLAAILLYGIGDAFRSGTHKGMIMDYLKLKGWGAHKVEYYGNTRSWSQRGSAVSALFAGLLVLYSGSYRYIYLFSIVPYLLNFINIFTYPDALNYSLRGKKAQASLTIRAVFKNFWVAIKNRTVFQVVNLTALHTAYLKAIKDYIQPVMLQVALLFPVLMTLDDKRKSGLFIGIIYFFIFLLTSAASKWSFKVIKSGIQNIPSRTLLLGLAAGALCGLLYQQEIWVLSLVAFIGIYVIENIRKPILTGLLADRVPNDILTSVLSAQSSYSTLITASLAVLIGVFSDQFGVGIALISISGFLILFFLAIAITTLTLELR